MRIVQLIPITDIVISPGRMRQEFKEDSLKELAKSISRSGLIHPITVKRVRVDEKEAFELVAGERRLRAMKLLKEPFHCIEELVEPGTAPCFLYDTLTELDLIEIEYAENVERENLNWQESALAYERLHNFRKGMDSKHTILATAQEVLGPDVAGKQVHEVSEKIILAKHLKNPEVAKAKSATDAMKIVRRAAEAQHRARLAEQFDLSKTPHTLIFGDAFEAILTLPDNAFDVLCTDPPFGIKADSFGAQADAKHDYEDSPEYAKKCIMLLAEQSERICKTAAHAYVFCDLRWFEECKLQFELCGWKVWHRPFIWDKLGGMLPSPDFGPRQHYECILYGWRGDRKVIVQAAPDVIRVAGVARPRRGAEKPWALFKELLSRSCRPGDTVLDPFAGTGPILAAATSLRLIATAIEREKESYNIAVTRLSHEVKEDEAPDIVL